MTNTEMRKVAELLANGIKSGRLYLNTKEDIRAWAMKISGIGEQQISHFMLLYDHTVTKLEN